MPDTDQERYKVAATKDLWCHGLTYDEAIALARRIWEMTGVFAAIELDS